MISTSALHRAAEREGLRFDQVEKDYIILCLLSAISKEIGPSAEWVFKGGTCLRHCYYQGYRFSEDIDFTCRPRPGGVDKARSLVAASLETMRNENGIESTIARIEAPPNESQVEIAVQYSRGGPRRQALPSVKVHLTSDEPVLADPELRDVRPTYEDVGSFNIWAYGISEIIAEKMRSLLQQQEEWPRPRDLYDLWYILCKRREVVSPELYLNLFAQKCEVRKIDPNIGQLVSSKLKEMNRNAWENQLRPMLLNAPDYEDVWREWSVLCETFR